MHYLFYILSIPFLYINYKIIVSDIQYKKIPNKLLKHLLFLIPFYYVYVFFAFSEIHYLLFLGQISLAFLVSFILYSLGIWAAGDAKYLLVLSLFIPSIGIIPFIGNIGILTLFYLLLYFIYFYFGKLIFNKKYRESLWLNVKQDISEQWKVYKGNTGGNTYGIILKWLIIFLILFVSIRLSRIYVFNSILENGNTFNLMKEFIEKYNIYLVFLGLGIFLGGLYLVRLGTHRLKFFIGERFGFNINSIGNIFISILFLVLFSFIGFEFIHNYEEISSLLFRVFTLYLGIYLAIKILIYSYKITFDISESCYIDVKNLKEGDIVDKIFLKEVFGQFNPNVSKSVQIYKENYTFIKRFSNPLNKKNSQKIIHMYKAYNNLYTKKSKKYLTAIRKIKVLYTFAFAPYIFLGFLGTVIIEDELIKYILSYIINIFNL